MPPSRSVRPEPVVVVLLVVLGVGVVVAVVYSAGTVVSPAAAPPGYPIGSAETVLFYGQSQNVYGDYQGQFEVAPTEGSATQQEVEVAAELNLTCGAESSYLIGALNNCTLSLIRGTTGGPTEDWLWSGSFTGREGSYVSALAPGTYTLLVSVHVGSPPLAVVVVPFSVTAEAGTIG